MKDKSLFTGSIIQVVNCMLATHYIGQGSYLLGGFFVGICLIMTIAMNDLMRTKP